MKSAKRAAIVSLSILVVVIAIGIVHTSVILDGKITPAQDEALSARYGKIAGLAVGIVWGLYAFKKFSNRWPEKR